MNRINIDTINELKLLIRNIDVDNDDVKAACARRNGALERACEAITLMDKIEAMKIDYEKNFIEWNMRHSASAFLDIIGEVR